MGHVSGMIWPNPQKLKTWTDSSGVVWRRVGNDPLKARVARRDFNDPEVAVVHFFGVGPVMMQDVATKSKLWSHIEPMVDGTQPDPYAEVQFFRFRDGSGRSMLAVQEFC